MASRRMLVLQKPADEPDEPGRLDPLGQVQEVVELFGRFNTAPEQLTGEFKGSTRLLYGPGMVVELPPGMERVTQAIVHLKDREIAWPVLWRLCQLAGWKMLDPDSGQVFG